MTAPATLERLLLDTSALLAVARGQLRMPPAADIAVPVIAVAEYFAAADTETETLAAGLRAFLAELLDIAPVCDFDLDAARHHGALIHHANTANVQVSPYALMVAAIARASDRAVFTTDSGQRYAELPGVRYVVGTGTQRT